MDTSWPQRIDPLSRSAGDAGRSGASASSAFSIVVLPTPFLPTRTIFSPRLTIALKSLITFSAPCALLRPLHSNATLPDGRFIANLMYGR